MLFQNITEIEKMAKESLVFQCGVHLGFRVSQMQKEEQLKQFDPILHFGCSKIASEPAQAHNAPRCDAL